MKKIFFLISIIYFLNFNISYTAEQKKLDIDWNKLNTKEGRLEFTKKFVEEKKWKWKKIYEKKGENFFTQSGVPIYAGVAYVDESTVSKTIGIMETYEGFILQACFEIFSIRVSCFQGALGYPPSQYLCVPLVPFPN